MPKPTPEEMAAMIRRIAKQNGLDDANADKVADAVRTGAAMGLEVEKLFEGGDIA